MSKILDLTDVRKGHLVAIKWSPEHSDRYGRQWLCQCDCGRQVYVRASNFNAGHSQSCGANCPCNIEDRLSRKNQQPVYNDCMVIMPPSDRERVCEVIDYILEHKQDSVIDIKKKFNLNSEEYDMISDLMMPAIRWYNEAYRLKTNILKLRESFKVEGSVKNDASRIVAMST